MQDSTGKRQDSTVQQRKQKKLGRLLTQKLVPHSKGGTVVDKTVQEKRSTGREVTGTAACDQTDLN